MSVPATGSLLSAIGLAAIDSGIQLAQMGTLTDPFSIPSHEAYYLTLQAWAVDPSTGKRKIPLMTHTFTVMPNQMQILKNYLSSVVSTPGGTYVDEFPLPDSNVLVPYSTTISGNFGKKARLFVTGNSIVKVDGGIGQLAAALGNLFPGNQNLSSASLGADLITGYGQTKFLDKLCDLSHQTLTAEAILQALYTVSAGAGVHPNADLISSLRKLSTWETQWTSQDQGSAYGTADIPVEVVLYNWVFHQFVVVMINQVQFSRNARLNLWSYSLKFTALRDAIRGNPTAIGDAAKSLAYGMIQNVSNVALSTVTGLINHPKDHTKNS